MESFLFGYSSNLKILILLELKMCLMIQKKGQVVEQIIFNVFASIYILSKCDVECDLTSNCKIYLSSIIRGKTMKFDINLFNNQ